MWTLSGVPPEDGTRGAWWLQGAAFPDGLGKDFSSVTVGPGDVRSGREGPSQLDSTGGEFVMLRACSCWNLLGRATLLGSSHPALLETLPWAAGSVLGVPDSFGVIGTECW